MALLGIDVGTGGSRAILINEQGKVLASATENHEPFASPKTGWAEQEPEDWWRASQIAIRSVLKQGALDPDTVTAIGLSGQMHGAVLLDASGSVVRPAIIWCDQRTETQCQWLTDTIGAARLIELTSNPALTGFTLPKLLWVREHEPNEWTQVKRVLLPKDYVRLRLTGAYATDVTDASGTLLFDVASRRWSAEIVDATDLSLDYLPSVFEGPDVTGGITADASSATGLPVKTPVVAGGGDQAAGAVGMGIVQPGAVSATIGTSGVVFAATDRPALDPAGRVHTFCHALPNRWHVMGVTQAAGLSLRWFHNEFGTVNNNDRDPYEQLCDEAATIEAGADDLLWAPYLMGERTPHLDPNARAALVGLTVSHTRAHIVRAILEGVAFSLRDSFTIFEEMKVPVQEIRLGGGGAKSTLWQQIQADVYGQQVLTLTAEEGAAYGAALLSGVGTGVWSSVDEACNQAVTVASRVDPDVKTAERMTGHYTRYRSLYPALKKVAYT
jgi:xylulokinase